MAAQKSKQILAIDAGTTGVTCLMVDARGAVTGRGYREVPQYFPQPGWVEHDPVEILGAVRDATSDAIQSAKATPAAIGITNQRETVVLWDRATGEPVHRAIVWQDRRTSDRCQQLRSRASWLGERTGLVPDPYFSATKLEWLLANSPRAKSAGATGLLAGTIDAWLIWKLTGGAVHATDPTNASRTMLYDINALDWSAELCAEFGIPREMLPGIRYSSSDFGVSTRDALGVEAPILGVAGDQQSALFGQGCWRPGAAKNTYGTGAFLLLYAGSERPSAPGEGLLTTVACDARGRPAYALEGAIFIAGAAVQWLRDGLGIIADARETAELARSIESTDGVYFVPALTGLGAPNWEPRARGTIVGLTRGTGKAHLARAALESMAYSTAGVIDAMVSATAAPFASLRVDGGATQNDWLMQFQSDVLGVAVERPSMVETTALGAAGLAGIAAGVWPTAEAFLATREYHTFKPRASRPQARALLDGWRRAVRAAVFWARDAAT